ncbi:MATE family efflux transporter [Roseibium suaedae]|uniref:Putative efflux protein, MATE family n=1 Tax=Roseibium suaedae TaxID=735517 RepID=A0A1M7PK25_9HYPH|nr:MATE family efflux transporter [Roseibium suaedae]SHN17572.1 putative efflux protein, MATE family [Roseibium suaedae]
MREVSHTNTSTVQVPAHKAPPSVLEGAIVPTMLRLALPTILVLVVQTLVGVAETYFISFLGTDALAGVTLVFPVLMLMQMMSNGGIGGGVASAVARSLGSERYADASALVWHSIIVACAFGVAFSAAAFFCGQMLYRSMGGTGATLEAALTYSGVVFAGSVPIWITAVLSSALRGAGNVKFPALVIFLGVFLLVPLSPALIFGWGPFPRLGVAGGGAAVVIYYILAAVMLLLYLRSPRSLLKLRIVPLEGRLFRDIMGVGILSAIGTVQVNLTVTIVTATVGGFDASAIAGYGIASRLDYIQIPVIFGLGTALVTMVGINIGAGQWERARHIAWTGAAIAFGLTELVGLSAAIFPQTWVGLFSDDADVMAMGVLYLRTVAPVYGAVGLGLALYFASQGANRALFPVLAGTIRMIIAAAIGWLAVYFLGAGISALFQIVALASVAYGVLTAAAMISGTWKKRPFDQ